MTRKPPPLHSRFKKGQSGNPKGRPKKQAAASASAFDIVIDKTLNLNQGGRAREVTIEEALQHQTYRAAIEGDRAARNQILKMILEREKYLAAQKPVQEDVAPLKTSTDPENADAALLILGIASRNPERQDPRFDGEQLLLEPWAVQAALTRRRGGQKLTADDITEIERSVRAPDTLRWPRGSKS